MVLGSVGMESAESPMNGGGEVGRFVSEMTAGKRPPPDIMEIIDCLWLVPKLATDERLG